MSFLAAAMEAAAALIPHLTLGMAVVSGTVENCTSPSPLGSGGPSPSGLKLKQALSSWSGRRTPLVDVLRAEGIPLHLRHVVVHGIAMCDYGQEAVGEEGGSAEAKQKTVIDRERCGAGVDEGIGSLVAPTQAEGNAQRGPMTAEEGVAALKLLGESMSRFGGQGAFMVPSWGCGSIPEAFVRCAGFHSCASGEVI